MSELTYTLLTDGSSDRALMPILGWVLRFCGVESAVQANWVNPALLPRNCRDLSDRISASLLQYPCDLLFVHRDGEKDGYKLRRAQISEALEKSRAIVDEFPAAVCVIPVRMTEAWLLFSEHAIRSAADRPNGSIQLGLPGIKHLDRVVDPKKILHDALRTASGLNNRRLHSFNVHERVHRVADLIDGFEPLLDLPAFKSLYDELREVISANGWNG